jgi:hypothetical protein
MATTKSTVLGFRLDHERRAWVEGEAARRGVTVRVLFEGLIDQAQAAASGTAAIPGEAGTHEQQLPAPTEASGPRSPPPPSRSLIYEAMGLTSSLIRVGGRCAAKGIGNCPISRCWGAAR